MTKAIYRATKNNGVKIHETIIEIDLREIESYFSFLASTDIYLFASFSYQLENKKWVTIKRRFNHV